MRRLWRHDTARRASGRAGASLRFMTEVGLGAATALLEAAPAAKPVDLAAATPSGASERPPGSRGEPPAPMPAERPGLQADSPTEIPPGGWVQIGKRVAVNFSSHRVMAEAASVTFYGLLALFPALAAFVSLYGFFADPVTLNDQLSTLQGVLPSGGMDILSGQLHALTSSSKKALGFGFLVGLATSLWSANAGVKSLLDALNVVYGTDEKRGFIKLTLVSFAFTLGGVVFLMVALGSIVVLPVALHFLGLDSLAKTVLGLARWPLLFLVVAGFLAVIFRWGPCRALAKWRWVTPGGLVATLLWILVSAAFSWYVSSFGNYNKTYGSLGAVIGFMTWMWLSLSVILTGALLDSELERQTEQDTTATATAAA